MTALGQFALDVVDGQVALAQGDGQLTDRIAGGGKARPGRDGLKEAAVLVGQVAKLVTEDAEGAGGIAEAPSDLKGGESFDEVGAAGFVLTLERVIGGEEEAASGVKSIRGGIFIDRKC